MLVHLSFIAPKRTTFADPTRTLTCGVNNLSRRFDFAHVLRGEVWMDDRIVSVVRGVSCLTAILKRKSLEKITSRGAAAHLPLSQHP